MYWCFLPMGEAAVVSSDSSLLCYPTPLTNPHPIGTAKWCRGAAGDILVVALVGHNINIFATTLHIGGCPSTCNQGTCHSVVTWTHLSWHVPKLLLQNTFQYYPSINGLTSEKSLLFRIAIQISKGIWHPRYNMKQK